MTKLEWAILNWAPVRFVRNTAKKVKVPGADGLSIYEISGFFFKELRNTKLNIRCAAVTYNFMMAIPPTLLVVFSLVPYLPLKDVQETILSTLKLIPLSPNVNASIQSVITDFMNKEQTGVLSFGILFTLFFSSNGMMGLINTFEKSLPVYIKRNGLKKRWTAIKLTIMLITVAILSLAAFIIQAEALNGILLKIFGNVLALRIASLALVALVIFCTISVIYTYGPSLTQRFRFVSTGSVFATILCIIATTGFFFLVNNFIHYNKVYGSIGTLMAFMIWIWLNTLVIILGYELNVSILLGKFSRNKDVAEKEAV